MMNKLQDLYKKIYIKDDEEAGTFDADEVEMIFEINML